MTNTLSNVTYNYGTCTVLYISYIIKHLSMFRITCKTLILNSLTT